METHIITDYINTFYLINYLSSVIDKINNIYNSSKAFNINITNTIIYLFAI